MYIEVMWQSRKKLLAFFFKCSFFKFQVLIKMLLHTTCIAIIYDHILFYLDFQVYNMLVVPLNFRI